MSTKRFFYIPAVLLLGLVAGLASLPAARAEPLAPIAATVPALGSGLPIVTAGTNLVEARYWRHHYYGRRYYWRHRHYYHRWHYRHRHWHHWHHHHWYRRHWHHWY